MNTIHKFLMAILLISVYNICHISQLTCTPNPAPGVIPSEEQDDSSDNSENNTSSGQGNESENKG